MWEQRGQGPAKSLHLGLGLSSQPCRPSTSHLTLGLSLFLPGVGGPGFWCEKVPQLGSFWGPGGSCEGHCGNRQQGQTLQVALDEAPTQGSALNPCQIHSALASGSLLPGAGLEGGGQ